MRRKLFTFLFAILASATALWASDIEVDGIWYDFDNSTMTASVTYRGSYTNSYKNEYTDDVTIPSSVTYNGVNYCVTSIGICAFSDCKYVTNVTIPNSVISIGEQAFANCSGLNSIIIPNGVTSIGQHAFAYCDGLANVSIPYSLTSIGIEAFCGCNALVSVIWNAKNCSSSSSHSNTLFNEYPPLLTSFVFGEEVEYIPAYLCYRMHKLTSITIPKSVKEIGHAAFSVCSGLTSFYNYSTTPQTIDGDVFSSVDKSSCTLYVPSESITLYKSANVWNEFGSIQAISEQSPVEQTNIIPVAKNPKTIINGHLLILRDGHTYTIHGQQLR